MITRSNMIAVVAVALACGNSQGTVLTFDFGGANGSLIPSAYGDRVADPTVPSPLGWAYGSAGGATPNVGIAYQPVLRLGSVPGGFGDLSGVVYRDRLGGTVPGMLEFRLNADPGWNVCLNGFDMAAFGEDLPAKAIQVMDGVTGLDLFRVDYDPSVDHESVASTWAPGSLPLRHKHFTFAPGALCATSLVFRLDLTQLITIGGSLVDRVGIDNVGFSQVAVPTPGTVALVGMGGAMAVRRRRGLR